MRLRVALFYHSLVSDWNHGNAHFLRGIALELRARGHEIRIFEPQDSWSRCNLVATETEGAVDAFHDAFPTLRSTQYRLCETDLENALDGVDLAIVHEWNDSRLIAAVGEHRRRSPSLRALFHDTHHRALTACDEVARFNLENYDAILAYGASLKHMYERLGWGKHAHVWHEAADVRTFYPRQAGKKSGDLVWIGNWGDEERSEELRQYFVSPVREEKWKASVFGVRYPEAALQELSEAGILYGGWLPNYEAPRVFAQFRATVHVPRRPYTRDLPGIPTIRVFEALACGIPLVSAPWEDREGLFQVGRDFLMARNGAEMRSSLRDVLTDKALAASLTTNGLETIRKRHTCGHRVNELLEIYRSMQPVKSFCSERDPAFSTGALQ